MSDDHDESNQIDPTDPFAVYGLMDQISLLHRHIAEWAETVPATSAAYALAEKLTDQSFDAYQLIATELYHLQESIAADAKAEAESADR